MIQLRQISLSCLIQRNYFHQSLVSRFPSPMFFIFVLFCDNYKHKYKYIDKYKTKKTSCKVVRSGRFSIHFTISTSISVPLFSFNLSVISPSLLTILCFCYLRIWHLASPSFQYSVWSLQDCCSSRFGNHTSAPSSDFSLPTILDFSLRCKKDFSTTIASGYHQ